MCKSSQAQQWRGAGKVPFKGFPFSKVCHEHCERSRQACSFTLHFCVAAWRQILPQGCIRHVVSWGFIRGKLGKDLCPVLLSGRVKDLVSSNLLNCFSGHLSFLVKPCLTFYQPPLPREVRGCRGNRCVHESPAATKARKWCPGFFPQPHREPCWLSRWPQAHVWSYREWGGG